MAGIGFYFAAMLFLTGYGNLQNHPDITSEIAKAFIGLNNMNQYSMPGFKNYHFDFDYELNGEDYEKSVMLFPDLKEIKAKHSVSKWLSRGSLTADVPEVNASVRHFYDPTMPEGKRYLQDVAIGPIMARAQEAWPNPHIDDVEWAIYGDKYLSDVNTMNHKFTWERGKKWFKEAFAERDEQKKDSLMALAWRALGETLHMIEDHGCPAHVRDDSHPAPRGYGSLLGDPDTYEEYMADNFKTNIASFASSGKVDAALKSSFASKTTIKEIAHEFAVWTNKNFFTNETIAGVNIYGETLKHKTHASKEYPSPKISESNYDPNTKYYIGKVGGHDFKLCVNKMSLYEFFWQGKRRGYPIFDEECVKSQAEILVPNIVQAGVNAIKLFIPKYEVKINTIENGRIWGSIFHKADSEYPTSSGFNGYVEIFNKTQNKYSKLIVNEGSFDDSPTGFKVAKDDILVATIKFGGIKIFSEEFKAGEQGTNEMLCNDCKVYITFASSKYQGENDTYWDHELCSYQGHNDANYVYFPSEQGKEFYGSWTGNTFNGSAKGTLLGPGSGNITVKVSGDGKKLQYLELTYADGYSDMNNFIVTEGYVLIQNEIQAKTYEPSWMCEYRIDGPALSFVSSLRYRIKCKKYPDMAYSLITNAGRIENIIVRFSAR